MRTFLKGFVDKFSDKSSLKFWQLFGILKSSILNSKLLFLLFGQNWKIGLLLGQNWKIGLLIIPTFGHTCSMCHIIFVQQPLSNIFQILLFGQQLKKLGYFSFQHMVTFVLCIISFCAIQYFFNSLGGSPGLVIMSSYPGTVYWMDIFSYLFVVKNVKCVWMDGNKWKRDWGWPISKKDIFQHLTATEDEKNAKGGLEGIDVRLDLAPLDDDDPGGLRPVVPRLEVEEQVTTETTPALHSDWKNKKYCLHLSRFTFWKCKQ